MAEDCDTERYQGWIGGDADVWCQEGHPPKIVRKHGDCHVCPDCNTTYRINVKVSQYE